MLIKFKKKSFIANLVMGLLWVGLFIATQFFEKRVTLWDYGYLLIGLCYIGLYFYNKQYQYLEIKNNIITKNFIPKRHFNLNSLSRVDRKFGDIKLYSEKQKTLLINPQIIDEDSLKALNEVLNAFETKTTKQ
jgi:hypothetical protein